MTDDIERTVGIVFRHLWKFCIGLLLLIVGVILTIRYGPFILHRMGSIFASVLAAILLTYALLPSVDWLSSKRIAKLRPQTQRLLATLVVFALFVGVVVLCVDLFITPFRDEIKQFSGKVGEYTNQLNRLFTSASAWYKNDVPQQVKDIIGRLDYTKLTAGVTESAQQLIRLATSSLGIAIELLLIPVLAFYFLLDHKTISREFYGLVPARRRKEAVRIGHRTGSILQSYIFGQIILCIIAGLATGLFLWGMHMPYIVVLALFAAITRAIPIIGPVVSGIPIVLVGLLYSPQGDIAIPLVLLTFITVMHFAESKFIMPRLIGDRLHLHPAVVIVVLLIGAEFMGVVGMFLAAPVAAIVREMYRLYYVKPRRKRRPAATADEQPAAPAGDTAA